MSTPERNSRIQKLKNLKENQVNPYPNRYSPEDFSADILSGYEDGKEQNVKVAGRVMLVRDFGKACFATLKDSQGTIQVYAQKDVIGEKFNSFKKIDVGDIIGVQGSVFKTQKGEITIQVNEWQMLAKAIMPLPEKFHGLTDVEMRYRQRYTDLIVNDEVKDAFITRSKIIRLIRDYLNDNNFLEVETPMLQQIPGGANARPFETFHNALRIPLFLRIAPELYLKRLIVGGMEKVYELSRVFRNEGISTRHNPEFTLLEVYEAYSDYEGMMKLTENLIHLISKEITGKEEIVYQGKTYSFKTPFERISMPDAIKKYMNIDIQSFLNNPQGLLKEAESKGFHLKNKNSFWHMVIELFEEGVEEKLEGPVFVTHYPAETTPLAKQDPENPDYVERFELFICGREHANAYSELNDPIRQKENFEKQVKQKAGGDNEAMYMDEDFVNALEIGMPPTGGLGIGIDRLVMLFIDSPSIRDTILFPQMKPKTTAEPEKWKTLVDTINRFSNLFTEKSIRETLEAAGVLLDEIMTKEIKKEKYIALDKVISSILEEAGENMIAKKITTLLEKEAKNGESSAIDLLKALNELLENE